MSLVATEPKYLLCDRLRQDVKLPGHHHHHDTWEVGPRAPVVALLLLGTRNVFSIVCANQIMILFRISQMLFCVLYKIK